MEKEIKITIPEGYDDAVFDNETKTVKFVKKEKEYIKSWNDYCSKYNFITPVYNPNGDTHFYASNALNVMRPTDRDKIETLARLIMLRKEWVGDWEPDGDVTYTAIGYSFKRGIEIIPGYMNYNRVLSFPNAEMAKKFAATFKSMLEEVKDWI